MNILNIILMATLIHASHAIMNPIVIIPGTGGNQLEARLNEQYKPSSLFCRLTTTKKDKDGWFRIWFDPTVLLGPITRCFAERMLLVYDENIDDYRNADGVETRVPYFGSTKGLQYLDPHLKSISEYMTTLITKLEQIGYKDGQNLFGAPYDFRYGLAAPNHPTQVGSKYLQDLQQLIESAYTSNGFKPVILLTHSLGSLFAQQLLTRIDPSWRAKYVKHLITLSAPWGGTVMQMLTYGSGSTFGIPIVNPLLVRSEQRSSESNMWLLPSPKLFESKTLVVNTYYGKTYTAENVPEFLIDIGYEEGVKRYKTRILPLVSSLLDPGVNVTCLIGYSVHTPETLVYGRKGFDVQPDVVYGDGDGTVNLESLLWLQVKFSDHVKVVKFHGVSHTSLLKEDGALETLVEEIYSVNSDQLSFSV